MTIFNRPLRCFSSSTSARGALRGPALGLAALGLLGGLSACDAEEPLDLDEAALSFEGEAIDDASASPAVPALGLEVDGELGPDQQPAQLININLYVGARKLVDIADGDLVMLRNYQFGHLGCDGSDDAIVHASTNNTEGYIWKLHVLDVDDDGVDEVRFELISGTTATGKYLKMDNTGDVFCDTISGSGNGASWELAAAYATGGTYRRTWTTLTNVKQSDCLMVDSSVSILGGLCSGNIKRGFNFEVVG